MLPQVEYTYVLPPLIVDEADDKAKVGKSLVRALYISFELARLMLPTLTLSGSFATSGST